MGWQMLAKPGTDAGPCPFPCKHTDCAQSRAMAEKVCPHCDEPIGFEAKFVEDNYGAHGRALLHFLCALEAAEP